MAFAVLPFYNTHGLVIYWVLIRSVRKALRYSHRLYLDQQGRGKKSCKSMPIESVCINMLAFSFPIEYLTSVVLVLETYPVARETATFILAVPYTDYKINLAFYFYYLVLAISLPYFLGALVYVWRKREKLVYMQTDGGRQVSRANSLQSQEDSISRSQTSKT